MASEELEHSLFSEFVVRFGNLTFQSISRVRICYLEMLPFGSLEFDLNILIRLKDKDSIMSK